MGRSARRGAARRGRRGLRAVGGPPVSATRRRAAAQRRAPRELCDCCSLPAWLRTVTRPKARGVSRPGAARDQAVRQERRRVPRERQRARACCYGDLVQLLAARRLCTQSSRGGTPLQHDGFVKLRWRFAPARPQFALSHPSKEALALTEAADVYALRVAKSLSVFRGLDAPPWRSQQGGAPAVARG
jgi:hypothetical protein